MTTPAQLLDQWIARQASPEALAWLAERLGEVAEGSTRALFLGFGMVPRKLGKGDLELNAADLQAAQAARSGWNPTPWSIDQAARTRLILSLPADDAGQFVSTLDKLFDAGEVGELVALYQALPLLPHAESHISRAAEGVRTNMKAVFCAVAHRNPYPCEQFNEGQWNQMVLKCLFVGVSLAPVIGIDERTNPALAGMLLDYAHERQAAGRSVSPELWRPVGPFAHGAALDDLKKVLQSGSELEQQAAALALSASDAPEARELLESRPQLKSEIGAGSISWDKIAEQADN